MPKTTLISGVNMLLKRMPGGTKFIHSQKNFAAQKNSKRQFAICKGCKHRPTGKITQKRQENLRSSALMREGILSFRHAVSFFGLVMYFFLNIFFWIFNVFCHFLKCLKNYGVL